MTALKLLNSNPVDIPCCNNDIKKEEIKECEKKPRVESLPGKIEQNETDAKVTTVIPTSETIQRSHEENSTQSTPSKHDSSGVRKNTFSSLYSLGSASTLSVRSITSGKTKPPNVLIYAESPSTTDNIKNVLSETLHKHK